MNFWEQPGSRARWRALLDSPDKANRSVAITLAQAHQLPDALRDEVLIEKMSHPDRRKVQTGVELALALGAPLPMEALYYRFLVIGTVGTSYGWVKPYLNESQRLRAAYSFKALGYGMESETARMLYRLTELDPGVSVGRIAYWLCASPGIRQAIRHLALQYLIDTGQQTWIEKALPHFMEEGSLRLAFMGKLPDALFDLPGVRELTCWGGNRQLDAFPAGISRLSLLEKLALPVNDLREIPVNLCKLAHLAYLDLSYNPIQHFPDCLARMPALKQIIITRPMLGEDALKQLEVLASRRPDLEIESAIS